MLTMLLTWFLFTALVLTAALMVSSYISYRFKSARGVPACVCGPRDRLVFIVGNALLATFVITGATFGSVDQNWRCFGLPYHFVLLSAAAGGAVAGVVIHFWERRLNTKLAENYITD